jgi:UDP-N-acetyl-D-glucosamine dehydrogenase
MLIVLESTTYPGTTQEVLGPMVEGKGFKVGKDIFLAFSPERVDPGNPKFTTKNIPKVVGGVTPACTKVAVALYSGVLENVHPVSTAAVAEMVKLLENTFRSVNIALVNEIALMSNRMGRSRSASCPSTRGRGSAGTASRSTRSTCRGRRSSTGSSRVSSSWRAW